MTVASSFPAIELDAPLELQQVEKNLEIKTVGEKTFIDTVEYIDGQTSLAELETVLGKARLVGGKVYFDELGLRADIVHGDKVAEVNVFFSKKSLFKESQPKKLFSGVIYYRGIVIKRGSKMNDLKKQYVEKKLGKIDLKKNHIPTSSIGRNAWWFYAEVEDKKGKAGKMVTGEHIGMITLWSAMNDKPVVKVTENTVAEHVPGKPGFVFNPYTGGKVDVRGIPSGKLVRDPLDPDAAHKFRTP